jgi:hypothetical protein
MTFGMISIAETTTDIITLDTPIEELNDLTLNEVFRDSQLLLNPEFTSTANWALVSATISNNELTYNSSVGMFARQSQIHNNGDVLYYINFAKRDNTTGGSNISFISSGLNVSNSLLLYYNNTLNFYSGILTLTDDSETFSITRIGGNSIITIEKNYLYNLTSLGISSLTQQQLDDYYDIYVNGGYYEYDAVLNDLDMTDFIIISSSFVLWLWFMRFVKGVL